MCVCGASMMALLHEFVCWMNCHYHSPHWDEGRGRGSRTKASGWGGSLTGCIRCM